MKHVIQINNHIFCVLYSLEYYQDMSYLLFGVYLLHFWNNHCTALYDSSVQQFLQNNPFFSIQTTPPLGF